MGYAERSLARPGAVGEFEHKDTKETKTGRCS